MKKLAKFITVAFIATLPFFNSSCEKTTLDDEYDVSFEDAKSVMLTEVMLNIAYLDIFNVSMRAGAFADEILSSKTKNFGDNSEILGGTMDILFGPDIDTRVAADWTDINKIGEDNISRRGGMIINIDGFWRETPTEISVGFGIPAEIASNLEGIEARNAYYINDYKVEGEVKFTNEGGNLYHIEIKNGIVTAPDGKVSKRNSNLYMKWKEGFETKMDITDDIWEMYGMLGGTTANDLDYTISISDTDALEKATAYKYPNKGVANFTIKGVKFSLDYAFENEEYDNKAILDFYGINKLIEFE